MRTTGTYRKGYLKGHYSSGQKEVSLLASPLFYSILAHQKCFHDSVYTLISFIGQNWLRYENSITLSCLSHTVASVTLYCVCKTLLQLSTSFCHICSSCQDAFVTFVKLIMFFTLVIACHTYHIFNTCHVLSYLSILAHLSCFFTPIMFFHTCEIF